MKIAHVPIVPIPNLAVLSELDMAIQCRAAELRQDASAETDPEYLKRLAERQGALAFLGEQIKRLRFQVAPTIDIVVDSTSEDAKPASDGVKETPAV